jgi:transcriptional regulator with XRE-family HTH domain
LSNERLRAALHRAGLEVEDLAELAEVDVKTARRWLAGRQPRGRYRTRVAQALGTTEKELWPEADIPISGRDERGEIIAAYSHTNDLAAPDWRPMLTAARHQIDLLDYTLLHVLDSPGVIDLLAEKASEDCQVRILIAPRDSTHLTLAEAETDGSLRLTGVPVLAWDADRALGRLQPLLATPGIEARSYIASRFNSILRFDEQMLATLHLYGTPAHQAPLLHLRHNSDHGLFEQFAAHYDTIWEEASQPIQPDPVNYPNPDQQPDRYQRRSADSP